MPALDALLRALRDHRMEALVLEPGRLPRLERGDEEREVSAKSPLEGAVIGRLLAEVAPAGATSPAPTWTHWEFEYLLDGMAFRFNASRTTRGWAARIHAAPPSPPPAAAPAPTPPAAEGEEAAAPPARPVTDLLELLREMVRRGASDLHLSSMQPPYLRVHGEMTALASFLPPAADALLPQLLDLAPPRNREQFEETSDTDFGFALPGVARFRVNVFRERLGAGAVFRQVPEKIPTADELGLPESIRKLTSLPKGLVLVTGPTGSGKSTTLAALVDVINRTRRDHLITIEDPIEFVHRSRTCLVHQREVGVHTRSFKNALRAALREDPDIVLVGEMRDLETSAIAIETAETGHLVFGTLHTTSAPSTIERLINQFPADQQEQIRLMLADSLRAVVAQTLLRRVQGGRVAAFEILLATPAVSNLIREGKTFQLQSIMQTGKAQGMQLLNDSLLDLVKRKLVEPREAYLKAVDRDGLVSRLQADGEDLGFLKELQQQR